MESKAHWSTGVMIFISVKTNYCSHFKFNMEEDSCRTTTKQKTPIKDRRFSITAPDLIFSHPCNSLFRCF